MTDHDTTQSDLVAEQLARLVEVTREGFDRIARELAALSFAAQTQRAAWERPIYDMTAVDTRGVPDRR